MDSKAIEGSESRSFALFRCPITSPCGLSVQAEWQTGYFDIIAGCTSDAAKKGFPWKAFRKLISEEATESGLPLLEPMKNGKVVLCAPQLFMGWAHHAGIPEAAATSISCQLLNIHARHLQEVEAAAFYGLRRMDWLAALTIEGGDLAHYAALSNWTRNARTPTGDVMAFCSIPVKAEATEVDWLLSSLVKPAMREVFHRHVKESGLLLWEELAGDLHHFYNVRCGDMTGLVRSYTGPEHMTLKASFFNAMILELNNLHKYPTLSSPRQLEPLAVEMVQGVEQVIDNIAKRKERFSVSCKDALKVVEAQNSWQFKASFVKRVITNCTHSEYVLEGNDAMMTLQGLRQFCKTCREPKKGRIMRCLEQVQNSEQDKPIERVPEPAVSAD
jgi:hypothetical protein